VVPAISKSFEEICNEVPSFDVSQLKESALVKVPDEVLL
jgi:hypothetical protein